LNGSRECVCERERERERETDKQTETGRERERERERGRGGGEERHRERERSVQRGSVRYKLASRVGSTPTPSASSASGGDAGTDGSLERCERGNSQLCHAQAYLTECVD